MAEGLNVPFLILDFKAGTETLRRRIAHCRSDASEAGFAVLERQLAMEEPLGLDEQSAVVVVDTEEPLESQALLKEIEKRTGRPGASPSITNPLPATDFDSSEARYKIPQGTYLARHLPL